jgi:hypothetical protein
MADIVKFKGNTLPSKNLGEGLGKALETASDSIEAGGGGLPYLKMDHKSGDWFYGQNDTDVEIGSLWAVNPDSIEKGYSYWKDRKSIKKMKNVQDGVVTMDMLPPSGGEEWKETVSFQLQCTYGEDIGTVVNFETASYRGKAAWKTTVMAIRKQLRDDPAHIVPVVEMLSTSYQHSNPAYGTIYNPQFKIIKWVAYDGGEVEEQAEIEAEIEAPKKEPAKAAAPSNGAAAPKRRVAPAAVVDVEEVEAIKAAPAAAADPITRRRRRTAAS